MKYKKAIDLISRTMLCQSDTPVIFNIIYSHHLEKLKIDIVKPNSLSLPENMYNEDRNKSQFFSTNLTKKKVKYLLHISVFP